MTELELAPDRKRLDPSARGLSARLLMILLILSASPLSAFAQEPEDESVHQYYVLYGYNPRGFPGGVNKHDVVVGGIGWSDLLLRNLALGVEVGIRFGGPQDSGCADAIWPYAFRLFCGAEGTFTPNLSYHFGSGGTLARIEPFLDGGYSLTTRNDSSFRFHYPHVGAGVIWWYGEREGVRFEIRDQLWHDDIARDDFEFRVGFVWH